MKSNRRWYHWALALLLAAVGSVGLAEPANAAVTDEILRAGVSVAKLTGSQEKYRRCVAKRESNFNPKAQNPRSSAQGTYQFLDSQWRRGLAHDVTVAIRDEGVKTPGLKAHLRSKPIKKWDPILQDVAFTVVLNADGKRWSGARHWYYPGSPCNRHVGSRR